MNDVPVLGIIGGSGLYNLKTLEDVNYVDMDTPFGKPSAPVLVGRLFGKQVAFLARHGVGHILTPGEVNYRANIYALKSLGVQQTISISAVGSLRNDYVPGQIVIPTQVFDFTKGRKRSFFGEGLVAHVGVADPFCDTLSEQLYEAVVQTGANVCHAGTLITIEGPRFSTRAESNTFRSWGMSLVGMTACPEVFLAREAEMCYAIMAHVTDYDVWHVSEEEVSVELVIKTLLENTSVAQQALQNLLANLKDDPACACRHALQNSIITQADKIPAETREKLGNLVNKYLSSSPE